MSNKTCPHCNKKFIGYNTQKYCLKCKDVAYKELKKRLDKEYEEKNREKINEMHRKWRKNNYKERLEYERDYGKKWGKNNPEKIKEKNKKYKEKYPEKIKAQNSANYHLKHLKKKGYVFHHPDYSKPLEVEILPTNIHQELHNGVGGQFAKC